MYPSASELGLTVVRSRGHEENVLCPFHADKKTSASYNRKKGLFNCYVCNLGLNMVQLSKRLGLTLASLESWEELARQPEDYELVEESEPLDLGIKDYHFYFKERGIGEETAEKYNLHWSVEDRAAVLPISNLRGKIIGKVHRYFSPETAGTRYRFFGETTPVWPMHLLKGARANSAVFVTEGAWSAMKLDQWFVDREMVGAICLALLGAKANTAIVDTLRPFDVVFLYDGDVAGTNACRKMRKLWPTANSWTVSKSPDDMDGHEISEMINKIYRERHEKV